MILVLSCPNNENDKGEKRDVWKGLYTTPKKWDHCGLGRYHCAFPAHHCVTGIQEAVSPPFHFGLQNHETVLFPSDYTIMPTNTHQSVSSWLGMSPSHHCNFSIIASGGLKYQCIAQGFFKKNCNSSRNTLNGKSALPPQSFSSGSANMGDKYSKTTNSIANQVFGIVKKIVFCFGLLPSWEIRNASAQAYLFQLLFSPVQFTTWICLLIVSLNKKWIPSVPGSTAHALSQIKGSSLGDFTWPMYVYLSIFHPEGSQSDEKKTNLQCITQCNSCQGRVRY